MQRSSDSIGAIAAALAKAQIELTNPEKSLTATIASPFPREDARTFRYAPLSTGLEIVRKCLGKHEIAAVQTTSIDKESGLIRLTTTLAHASGEWMSSEWPVCPVSETNAPHRLGAALTYARRHSLFTLVGIAGDDDTDAPTFQHGSAQGGAETPASVAAPPPKASWRTSRTGTSNRQPTLSDADSATRRDTLLAALANLNSTEDLAAWAQKSMSDKNALSEADARAVEEAFAGKTEGLAACAVPEASLAKTHEPVGSVAANSEPEVQSVRRSKKRAQPDHRIDKSVLTFPEPRRIRDKEHLKFVGTQPCLICGRSPSDAHHIRFAQLRALGRKVSDEFTVPLCRGHHRQLHQTGDEAAFWRRLNLEPLKIASQLWQQTRSPAAKMTQQ